MSAIIENRILEMRFDNKQFENGVATTMSTLDKLKQKLHLDGATKGLENIGKIAKNTSFLEMATGINQVKKNLTSVHDISAGVIAKFTVIHNLTNSLIKSTKRMVSALTVDPIKSGFREYETQIGAIQTILSNTRQEGTNVAIVNRALDELNEYADKTIYNFTEMTRNIGTFTAAGVKLDTSVKSIKGIANLAAVSGSTSQQASNAMYQLSQALAAGKVSLMDWNSVVNAGMGGKLFQDALIRTSNVLGTGADEAVSKYGNFRESLTKGEWLTTEVLTETLNQLAGAYDKADLMAQGFSESQADEIMALAKDAEEAATKVKTFTQLWDVMKEAAQSGWSQTWRIIIGDFEEARELFTSVSDYFTEIIGKISDARNNFLKGGLSESILDSEMFDGIKATIENILGPIGEIGDAIEGVTSSFGNISSIVDDVIRGNFGNGQERIDNLTKAGHDWVKVQNAVNAKLGVAANIIDDQTESQKKSTEATEEQTKKTKTLTEEGKKRLIQLTKLSNAELRAQGYTIGQIASLRDLQEAAEKIGLPFEVFIEHLDNLNGRLFIIESLKNIGKSIETVFRVIGSAWRQVFKPLESEKLTNAIFSFHKFTETLRMNSQTIAKLKITFSGLFYALEILTTILGGSVKFAFEVLTTMLGIFDTNILNLTASIGSAIRVFRNWLFEQDAVSEATTSFVKSIPKYVSKFKDWFKLFKNTPLVKQFIDSINKIKKTFSDFSLGEIDLTGLAASLGTNIANALKAIPDIVMQIGRDVIAGFQNGLKEGTGTSIFDTVLEFCNTFIESFKAALGVHSPSTITFAIAGFVIAGFVLGLLSAFPEILTVIKLIGTEIVDGFKFIWGLITDESGKIEWDKLFASGLLLTGLVIVKQFIDAIKTIADATKTIAGGIGGVSDLLGSFSKKIKAQKWDIYAQAVVKMALAIAILAGSLWVLTTIDDPKKLWNAVGVIGALAGILLALALSMEFMSKSAIRYENGKLDIKGIKSSILQIGAAVLMLAFVVKMIGDMRPEEAKQGFIGLAGIGVGIIAFIGVLGLLEKSDAMSDIDKIGKMMTKLSIAMILMTVVCRLVSGLSAGTMIKAGIFAVAFATFVIQIAKVAKSSGNNVSKVGGLMIKLSIAMMLMVGIVELIDLLSPGEMFKGAIFATAFCVFVNQLVKSTKIGKRQQIAKLGGLLLSISFSLMLMVAVCKLVGGLSTSDIANGIVFVGAFLLFLKSIIAITKVENETQLLKVGTTIFAVAVAVGMLAATSVLLGLIKTKGLIKGIAAVGFLSVFMSSMIKALNGAKDAPKSITKMAVAIGVMAFAIAALSFIPAEDLAAATLALSSVMGMFALMEYSMKGLTNIKMGPLIAITIVVILLAGIVTAISLIPNPSSTIEIVSSISILLLALAGAMTILDNTSDISKSSLESLLVLSLFAGAIGLLLTGLSKLNPGAVLPIATAMSEVLIAISTSALILSKVGPIGMVTAKGAAALVAVVTLAGAILGIIGGCVAGIDGAQEFLNNGIPILESIGRALGVVIGGIIGGIGEGITGSLNGIIEDIKAFMSGLSEVAGIGLSIKAGSFDGVSSLVKAMIDVSIGSLVEKFSSDILGESSMSVFSKNAAKFITTMSYMSMLLKVFPVNDEALEKVAKCGTLFSELVNTLPKTGGLVHEVLGEKDLGTFGKKVKAFIDEMIAVNESTNKEGFTFNEAAMTSIATAGTKFSDLVNALPKAGSFIADNLLGEKDLEAFGKKVKAFIDEMLKVNESVNEKGFTFNETAITSIATAGTKFSDLVNALPKTGSFIADNLLGEKDLVTFGIAIRKFIGVFRKINTKLGKDFTLNEAAIDSVKLAGEKFVDLQSSLPRTGGWDDAIMGKDDLGTFGETVGAFAEALGVIKEKIGDTGITEATITSISNTGDALLALNEALPTEGWFDGKITLTTFSEYIKDFSTALGDFSDNASKIDSASIGTAISAAYNLKYLIEAVSGIDTSGIAPFTGIGPGGPGADGPVHKLAVTLRDFGKQLADVDIAGIHISIIAAEKLRELFSKLSTFDPSTAEKFKIDSVGVSIQSYGETVKSVNFEKVTSSITAANQIKRFIEGLSDLSSDGVANFKAKTIALSIRGYYTSILGVDIRAIATSLAAAKQIKAFISDLSGLDTSGVGSFVTSVNKLGNISVEGLGKSLGDSAGKLVNAGNDLMGMLAKGIGTNQNEVSGAASSAVSSAQKSILAMSSSFIASGRTLMNKLIAGISSKKEEVASNVKSSVSSAAGSIRHYHNDFYNNARYLGDGLVIGINSKWGDVYNAGFKLGQAAVQGEKKGQQSNSPSKLTIQAGKWVGEGLVIGMHQMADKVYNTGYDLGDSAARSMSNVVSKVSDLINSGIDSTPTIRPVIDLSNVRSGVGQISGMLSNTSSIGVMANLSSINSSMNNRNQNGTTNDIINAIDKMRKDMNAKTMGNTTYSVGGVSYSSGSEVSDAIGTLVRALEIEGRV